VQANDGPARNYPADPTFDWPSVFKPGDVVRDADRTMLGVIVHIGDCSWDDTPRWELHVDTAEPGVGVGMALWDPWHAVLSNDPESIAEAKRLGLRWPTGHLNE
jgi:hypothetical protein